MYSLQSPRPTPASADPRRGVRHDTHDIIRQHSNATCELLRLYQEQATAIHRSLSASPLSLTCLSPHVTSSAYETPRQPAKERDCKTATPSIPLPHSLASSHLPLSLSALKVIHRQAVSGYPPSVVAWRILVLSPLPLRPRVLSRLSMEAEEEEGGILVYVCVCANLSLISLMVKGRVAGHVVSQNGALAARRACAALVP